MRLSTLKQSVANGLEVARLGRLTQQSGESYEVVAEDRHYRLRYYRPTSVSPVGDPLVLIPPLMLTAEIYDVAPALSAVAQLRGAGVHAYVVDFGAPERQRGGMDRTLDDHVCSVDRAIAIVARRHGCAVHLCGYSQGGMFAYQAAAYRRSKDIASVITFGSPVDLHRSVPAVDQNVVARLVQLIKPTLDRPLRHIDGLPGRLTSAGFKILSLRREVSQLIEFLQLLHDRKALERRESRRRFLAGEGFVAWPGPALRQFVDELVLHNRMLSGGLVIRGRTVSLGDLRSPILSFIGARDELARPAAVRSIARAAPYCPLWEATLSAGHFGLVVGTVANRDSWPTVIEWIRYQAGEGAAPRLATQRQAAIEPAAAGDVEAPSDQPEEAHEAAFGENIELGLFADVVESTFRAGWVRLGDWFRQFGESIDGMRYGVRRLEHLREIDPDAELSFAGAMHDRAQQLGGQLFFLWRSRAFTYQAVDDRIDRVARGIASRGIRPGHRVLVLMAGRPSLLTACVALNRIRAVAVLAPPTMSLAHIGRVITQAEVDYAIVDPPAQRAFEEALSTLPDGRRLVLGGGERLQAIEGAFDLERLDVRDVAYPDGVMPNQGRASELAFVFASEKGTSEVRLASVSNARWALSAWGTAAACTLSSRETVYCALPLHHPAGLVVSVGGTLVGGARMALAEQFDARVFWTEIRRYGVTVALYAGDMCRELVEAPPVLGERESSLRLFAGSGMRPDVWRRVKERFRVSVLEFYAATEGRLVLANTAGTKVGSLGRPLPGSVPLDLWRFDPATRRPKGLPGLDLSSEPPGANALMGPERCGPGEPGVLVGRVDRPLERGSSADDPRYVQARGARWFVTDVVLTRDRDGDYWLVDRASDLMLGGTTASVAVEDAVRGVAGVLRSGVVEVDGDIVISVESRADEVVEETALVDVVRDLVGLAPTIRLRLLPALPLTDGFRPRKDLLRSFSKGGSRVLSPGTQPR